MLKEAGVPQAVVLELIGHDSPVVSQRYTHCGLESLQKGLRGAAGGVSAVAHQIKSAKTMRFVITDTETECLLYGHHKSNPVAKPVTGQISGFSLPLPLLALVPLLRFFLVTGLPLSLSAPFGKLYRAARSACRLLADLAGPVISFFASKDNLSLRVSKRLIGR